ncbi:GNAT family N-acetyltransferase [Deinococcus peraridilitoris]|uniref:Acetyltransferase, N-acetylglutamate synthase n=1 Tax=Deinococcus peraridilitoris (strain DSM 19664 / LMG 22246 / CIP 109416 / KR-200) TaxID=937777 RepID=K9ZYF1_DEIPD|nr:GNAT family N-acetyltransferase [Deinococcus peraridilitoris]AFZ65785.1 acetyltransferase, N-acetylglutamate synthase [Deinococcus peraridilitoris DSM 19664]
MSGWSVRRAEPDDAPIIARHRYEADGPQASPYEAWVHSALERGLYLGWLAETEGKGNVIGGAGLTLLEWGPTRLSANPWRARVVNVFTEPDWRRLGLGRQLLKLCLTEADDRGIREVSLGATLLGRALYEQLGFRLAESEMRRTGPLSP